MAGTTIWNAEEAGTLPDNTACSSTNSMFDGGTFGTVVFRNVSAGARTMDGSWSYQIAASGVGQAYGALSQNGVATNGPIRIRFFFYTSTAPTDATWGGRILTLEKWQSVGVPALGLWLDTGGHFVIGINATGVDARQQILYTSTMSLAFTSGNWCRVELVIDPGSGANTRIGFAAISNGGVVGAGPANNRFTPGGANSANEAYFYTTTANIGSNQGIKYVQVGKKWDNGVTYSWSLNGLWDAGVCDNQDFGTDPNGWIGNIHNTFTDVFAPRATPTFTIAAGTLVNVKNSDIPVSAAGGLILDPLQTTFDLATLRASTRFFPNEDISRQQSLAPMNVASSLVLDKDLIHQLLLSYAASSALLDVPGAIQPLSMGAQASLSLAIQHILSGTIPLTSTSALEILGRVIAAHPSDDVLAVVLNAAARAKVLDAGVVAAVMADRRAAAAILSAVGRAQPVPNGSIVVVKD